MGFYGKYIFPKIVDRVMDMEDMRVARDKTLAGVTGDIFEIGFGTGLNLEHYPQHVRKITTADVNPGMAKAAKRRITASNIEVDNRVLNGESLPFDDASFDSVVCTWTLCSIQRADKALAELRRVLRPRGRFFFIEHGLSDDPKIRKWQHRLTPYWKILGDGCHLDRDAGALLRDNGFALAKLENFYMDGPKFATYMYQGIAEKT
ncbi:MAG: class I SAM-dependent methyltransferase [Candidatus Hydrogenedentota bacterium]